MTDQSHIEWLKGRTGVGGSEAAAIAGVHPYKSALDVYNRIVLLLDKGEVVEIEDNWNMRMGRVLEPVAAALYAEDTGRKIRKQPQRSHPDYDFIIGNVDRQILAGTAGVTESGILEVKCPQLHAVTAIRAHGLPEHIVTQHQYYIGIYRYSWGSYVVFNQNTPLIYFDMQANQEFIELIFGKVIDFWHNHIIPRIPPEPKGGDEPKIEVPEVEGELTVVDTADWREMAEDFREARELKNTATALENIAKEKIEETMHRDELHAVEVPGIAKFYYRWMNGNTRWKPTAEAIAKEANLKVEDFVVKGNGYKKFNPYFLKGGN